MFMEDDNLPPSLLMQTYAVQPSACDFYPFDEHFSECIDRDKSTKDGIQATARRKYTFIIRSKGSNIECSYCGKVFKYRSKHDEHVRTHTGERPFKCFFCPATFTQKGAVKSHERTHSEAKPYECMYCDNKYRTSIKLSNHMKSHKFEAEQSKSVGAFENDPSGTSLGVQNVYLPQNPVFDASMRDKEGYYMHGEMDHYSDREVDVGFDDYAIVDTDHRAVEPSTSADHVSTSSQDRFDETVTYGEVDGRILDETGTVVQYIDSNDQPIEYFEHELPPEVMYVPSDPSNLMVDGSVQFVDSYGNPADVGEGVVADGSGVSHGDYMVVDEYGNAVDTGSDLTAESGVAARDGYMLVEQYGNESSYPETQTVLAGHKLHKNTAPRRRYRRASNLQWIIDAVASGQKLDEASPYKRKKPVVHVCEVCGLTLKYPSKIKAHMRTHTGEKPFECDLCGRTFAMNSTLRMHIRRHLQDRSYACTYPGCDKTFVNLALLNHHTHTRHSARRFACLRGCGSTFSSNRDRERHELRYHSSSSVSPFPTKVGGEVNE